MNIIIHHFLEAAQFYDYEQEDMISKLRSNGYEEYY